MVPRLPRNVLPTEGIYHVTARGVARMAISRDDEDRRLYLVLLARAVLREAWECHAFCLMPNHYHLVVETALARLSSGVHGLNGVYAQRFNERHGRSGHLFRQPLRRVRDQERRAPSASMRIRRSESRPRGPLPRGSPVEVERSPLGRDYPPAACDRRMI